MLKGFRDFIMRGNVIDLAVGIVIGAAFSTLVKQVVDSFVTPLILVAGGGKEVSGKWRLTDNVSMDWGAFISATIAFLVTAAVLYFLVVLPMNKINELRRRGEAPEPATVSDEVRLLTEIRDELVAQRAAQGPGYPRR